MKKLKKIALLTRARRDNFFLERWMNYYGPQIGFDNIYIYLDGKDQDPPQDPTGKVHIELCDRIPGNLDTMEGQRLSFLSDKAAELFAAGYEVVIGCDADEYIVVEPRLGMNLAEYISRLDIKTSVSGLGFDVGQRQGVEPTFDYSKGFLAQRHYALIAPDYTKPCIINKPVRWGSGFHRIKGHNYHIDPNLYTFHFGGFDFDFLKERCMNSDLKNHGWEKHLEFRTRTISLISENEPLRGDEIIRKAQFIQKWFRPPYKWNRPSMLNQLWVYEIPERFWNVV